MAYFFRVVGRLAGQALRSHAVNRAMAKAAGYVLSEMKLADIKLKLKLLQQKRKRHLALLGKTIYRLTANDVEPFTNTHTLTITRVLREIDMEIEAVGAELQRRREMDRRSKTTSGFHQ